MAATIDNRVAELERASAQLRRQLDACSAELKEAREQQTATAEVLQVINSSAGDLASVFDPMLEKATRLCEAAFGTLLTYDGEFLRFVGMHNVPKELEEYLTSGPIKPDPNTLLGRAVLERRTIHTADNAAADAYRTGVPLAVAAVNLGGIRTVLHLPLIKDDAVLGVLIVFRQEVRAFTDRQIAMLENFAAQAVIAMENARLLTETREALEQQTATAEVLGVINSSPGDLAPVFDAILEKAHSLCGAAYGGLLIRDDQRFDVVAIHGDDDFANYWRGLGPLRPAGDTPLGRLLAGEPLVQVADASEDAFFSRAAPPEIRRLREIGRIRTLLLVPLRKDHSLLGVITAFRQEVRPFTDKQIALLENFAAQAVIAMENARLLTETREALEQQTATAEVLQVINSSPGDLAPVFDAMLEKAHSLCGVARGSLELYDGENFRAVATHGLADGFAEQLRRGYPASANPATRPLIEGHPFAHILDRTQHEFPFTRSAVVGIAGTLLAVPLRKEERLLGAIFASRQEVRPFSDKQIALLQNFAAQAVIAMENARLITETREALEQQTATAEVLQVINSSPGDLSPVFGAMLEKATELCDAAFGILWIGAGSRFRPEALHGVPPAFAEYLASEPTHPAEPGTGLGRIAEGDAFVHLIDPASTEAYRTGSSILRRAFVDLGGTRTLLTVPLRKDGALLGALSIYRQEIRAFSERQIALVTSFAAQAVIAMENARLITETREALEQQTATAEVLQVINSSPGDLAPVFDAMVERAARLCDADEAALRTFDGELLHLVAVHGSEPDVIARLRQLGPTRPFGLYEPFARGEAAVHIADVRMTDIFRDNSVVRERLEIRGIRTWLAVVLHKEGVLLGVINVHRHTVRPFSDKQIALLQNFAAQAVIAMENARLITETREALEQQTATAQVLQVINSSPGDLVPVFEAMLERALRLCEASFGVLSRIDGENFSGIAVRGASPALAEALRQPRKIMPGNAHYRLVRGEDFVQIEDITAEEIYRSGNPTRRVLADVGGARTALWVALRKEDAALGAFVVYRQEVRPFTDKQIALLQNFAAQAVIAMENARLITETREALEQQTATAEVLQVINSSPGDLAPVFDAILEKAHSLCGAPCGSLQTYDGEYFRAVATRGLAEPFAAILRQGFRIDVNDASMLDPDRVIQIADEAEVVAHLAPDNPSRAAVELTGTRTVLFVPLHKDNVFLGRIVAARQEVRPFTDKQVALLQNFAAQAVIAMENARLITETREALEQQTATAEVLQVINSSPGDLAPVFDAMLGKATTLCEAVYGHLWTYDGQRFHPVAFHGEPGFGEYIYQRGAVLAVPDSPFERILKGERCIHIPDVLKDASYDTSPGFREVINAGGIRTQLTVALSKDDVLLGLIVIYRQEVRPFSNKQISLLQNFAAQAVIAMENARLITETREALEQQTATAEVLQVINSSPGDLAPVFDAILEKAHTLCGVASGGLVAIEGGRYRPLAVRGEPGFAEAWMQQGSIQFSTTSAHAQQLRRGEPVHIPDFTLEERSRWSDESNRLIELSGSRCMLVVPLRKDEVLFGAITALRKEAQPFYDKEIALLQNFAAQAVIAMENARLLTETREALAQQTATAEVLQVINSSPGDLAPVFDAMLDKAMRLCGAAFGQLHTYDGEGFPTAALRGLPAAYAEYQAKNPPTYGPGTAPWRIVHGEHVVHLVDLANSEAYRAGDAARRATVDLGGCLTLLTVALRREGTLLGTVSLYRQEVRPFSDKQIALLQNFAAQAVIAMENARLLTETREALEQQTATAEVLQVINSSPGDLAPVFDAMLNKATRLCDASFGILNRFDGEVFRAIAVRGVSGAAADMFYEPVVPDPGSASERLVRGAAMVHIPDVVDTDAYRSGIASRLRLVEVTGARAVLWVALRKDDALLGSFVVYRKEVRPFSDKQIALLQNFAAQAVIAMENARLITETREALEQQTATAEVLQVINSSPGDLVPVFDAMLNKALRLCDFAFAALWTYDGTAFHPVALHGMPAAFEAYLREHTPPAFKLLHDSAGPIHFPDVMATEMPQRDPEFARVTQQLATVRTLLLVPLRKDAGLLGAFVAYRQEVRPFSDKQISLLQNFAAQAVIAMENARLLTETREALEQQTATAEVLQVINSSPGDLAPVFGAMLEKAMRLCEVDIGALWTYDGEMVQTAAVRGAPLQLTEFLRQGPRRPSAPQRWLMSGERVVQITDITTTRAYRDGDPLPRALADVGGVRTFLAVPLRKDDTILGNFAIYRQTPRPFSEKQIALLQNFAAQAVIAMENARLLNELRQRTRDLQESLEYQTATSDVLKVISQSTFDLGPVLENVIETALRLCRAHMGSIFRLEDGVYRWAVGRGLDPAYQEIEMRTPILAGPGTVVGRAALEGRAVQIADAMADPLYAVKDEASLARARTMLGVPLLREGAPIGVIAMARDRIEPFSEREVALVTTFADQAVIAIENARLFDELRERTAELGRSVEELKMLGEVGRAVSSTLDLRAVLSTILTASLGMTWATAGAIFRYIRAERAFRLVEAVGWDAALLGSVSDLSIAETETLMSEAALQRTPIQLTDLAELPSTRLRDASLAAGLRSVLIVPLVGPERIFGALVLQRREAGEFPAETVRLMQTLASQSVLAIQNARLFREIADKSEQLALASEHKSQFLANMSHELRTPLNAILGYAELLVDGIYGVLPEKAQGVLERVQNNGKHLLALINDVLDLAKIEAGQLALTLEDYSLAEVVRGVVTATEPLAAAKGLKFTAIVQEGMPMAHGDARRVSQVLLNLAGNAIKFTDAGEVEINASAANGQFLLTVRDTGPGIADADQERIFGEFQQIDNSDTRKKGGTGLGLAISKRMVEMQGGMISVDSVLGAGSTFRVALPVHVEPALEEAA